MFSKAIKVGDDRLISVTEMPHTGFTIEGITLKEESLLTKKGIQSIRMFLSTEATEKLRDILNEIDFEQEDEAQEEVREKNKSNKHIGREDAGKDIQKTKRI